MNTIICAAGVYKITNKVTGQIYIGSTVNLKRRKYEHFNVPKSSNIRLQRAIRKYGVDNFIWTTLEFVNDERILNDKEQYYLDTLKPFGKKGYNLCEQADSMRGYKRPKSFGDRVSMLKKGIPRSLETIRKMSESLKGNIPWNKGISMDILICPTCQSQFSGPKYLLSNRGRRYCSLKCRPASIPKGSKLTPEHRLALRVPHRRVYA